MEPGPTGCDAERVAPLTFGKETAVVRIITAAILIFVAMEVAAETLRLATTTSTVESGILDLLVERFEKESGLKVQTISVGSGKAMKLGENGDVDVLLVHSPVEEEAFVAAGHGIDRRAVMHNDLVILGPADDPAGVRRLTDAAIALKRIAGSGAPFVSRGDDSGTHKSEQLLWQAAGIAPDPKRFRYIEAGQGMSAVIRMADELKGYTLADRATYEKLRLTLTIAILVEGDPRLMNRYSVITVNPQKHPSSRYAAARRFTEWLISPACRTLIEGFAIGGRRVFFAEKAK